MQQRQWPNQYFCAFCFRNLKTPHHLFAECPVVRSLWTMVANWLQNPAMRPTSWSEHQNLTRWYADLVGTQQNAKLTNGLRSLAMLTIWTTWRERNQRIFQGKEQSNENLLFQIKDEASTWVLAGAKNVKLLGALPIRE